MAIIQTRINGSSSQAGYGFYANVYINTGLNPNNTVNVQVDTYLVNNGSRFGSGGWTKHTRIDQANEPHERTYTNQTIDTQGVDRYGGETLIQSELFYVPITNDTIYIVSYISKGSYESYEPGYCILASYVSMPKVQSTWASSLISIPDITQSFTLPINKYVNDYYNVVEVRNNNNTILVKTINDAVNGTSVSFTSSELNTIYTMDNNANQLPLRFYLDLKTYTDNTKTTQIGSTQRTTCEASLVNSNPTAEYTIVEQDANVIALLGSSTSNKVIKQSSDLLFTITPTAKNGATIKSVKVNDVPATYDSQNQVYVYNATNITTGTFYITITDSRNLMTPYAQTKTLIDYLAIQINSWTIPRVSQTSDDLKLTADITCFSSTIDGNTNTPTVQYSIDNSTWTTISSSSYTFQDNKITITNLVLQDLIDYQTSGKFYLKITDLLTTAQENKDVAVGIYTIAKGDRKVRINGTLELADRIGNNRINVGDGTIVEKGTGYIKYGNGIMICYGKETITTAINSSWGSLYVSSLKTLSNYASAFTSIYSISFDAMLGSTAWVGTGEAGTTTLPTTRPPKIYLISGVSNSSDSYVVSYIAIGTWK